MDAYQHFEIFRTDVRNEDTLVNSRLLWNINIQGFLFAAYGLSIQRIPDPQNGHMVQGVARNSLAALIFFLPLLGFSISWMSYKGIRAAQIAISSLNRQWKEIVGEYYKAEASMLPMLIGGGCPSIDRHGSHARKAHQWGLLAPNTIPRIFMTIWALLFTIHFLSVFAYYLIAKTS